MTSIPHILYHGTTMLRWMMIRKEGKLNAFVPKFYKEDTHNIMGYLYFTTSTHDAASCGLMTCLVDQRFDAFKERVFYNRDPEFKDVVVIGIRTSHIRKDLEMDPEDLEHNKSPKSRDRFDTSLGLEKTRDTIISKMLNVNPDSFVDYEKRDWYRHKGNLDIKYTFPHRIYPYAAVSSEAVDRMNAEIDMKELGNIGVSKYEIGKINLAFCKRYTEENTNPVNRLRKVMEMMNVIKQ